MSGQKYVYLCGPITEDKYTWDWREEAVTWFSYWDIGCLNPLRGRQPTGMTDLGYVTNVPGAHFVARDINDVYCCNAILVNFTYIPDRQMIGSLVELGIATATRKPFVVVATHERIIKHPFIYRNCIDIVPELEEGMEIVKFLLS